MKFTSSLDLHVSVVLFTCAAFGTAITSCGTNTVFDTRDSETSAPLDTVPADTGGGPCANGEWQVCDCDGEMTGMAYCEDSQYGACECTTEDGDFDRICTSCHGDAANPAPPIDLSGASSTARMTIGAHRAHLNASDWHQKLACAECHVVPATISTPGHIDNLPADLTWGTLATADDASPQFNRTSGKCDSTYCHGSTLSAGSNVAPVWTNLDAGEAACGTCHGLPPQDGHPTSTACGNCHGEVYDGTEFVNAALHINGEVNVGTGGTSCTACHGTEGENAAPPSDTQGRSDNTLRSVGAHQSHLATSDWHQDVSCDDCHVVPASADNGHIDGTPLLTFGDKATSDGSDPDFTGTTCSGTYCHGTTLDGGTNTEPQWASVGTGEVDCGTCHGLPPQAGHPASTACGDCHGEVYNGTAFVDREKHINGTVEVNTSALTCTSCHGTEGVNAAPPSDTLDRTDTALRSVGAHQSHLGTSNWRKEVTCDDCHIVPAGPGDSHNNGVAQITWGDDAQNDGSSPAFDGTNCNNVYCHGTTLNGGSNVAPEWGSVGTGEADCGTCHSIPPGGGHPSSTACGDCHGAVISAFNETTPSASTWADPSLHINGAIEVIGLSCTTCHGTDGVNAAPPVDTTGGTATSLRSVGAHQSHLASSTWHKAFACDDCHLVPSSTSHSDGTLLLTFGDDAVKNGATPDFNGITCTGTYCHGSTLNANGADVTPTWTIVNGTEAACGNCHGIPPTTGHTSSNQCGTCHAAVHNGSAFVAPELHIDGIVQAFSHDLSGWTSPKTGADHHGSRYFNGNGQRDEHNTACTTCHGANLDGGISEVSCNSCHASWRTCTFCHGNPPPEGADGETSLSSLSVGKHAAHVARGYACTTCHTVPSAGNVTHAAGHVRSTDLQSAAHHGDVLFTGTPAGGTTWNVNATVGTPTVTQRGSCLLGCHSNGNGGNPATTPYWAGPAWTGSTCGRCHAAVPNTNRHDTHVNGEGMLCTECHPNPTGASHLNGVQDVLTTLEGPITVTANACSSSTLPRCSGTCHGETHSSTCWSN